MIKKFSELNIDDEFYSLEDGFSKATNGLTLYEKNDSYYINLNKIGIKVPVNAFNCDYPGPSYFKDEQIVFKKTNNVKTLKFSDINVGEVFLLSLHKPIIIFEKIEEINVGKILNINSNVIGIPSKEMHYFHDYFYDNCDVKIYV